MGERSQEELPGLGMNDYKEGFSIHRDGESSARELTAVSGPGKMRGLEKSGGAVQGSQLGESQVQGRGPGLDGLGLRERAREGARSVCRLCACLRFTGSKTFTTFPEGSLTLRGSDLESLESLDRL